MAPPLPSNLDAERSILGAILLDNNALNAAIEALKPDDFFIPQHRNIFTRMIALGEAQQAIDLVTLTEELHRRSELDSSGGAPYLASLVDSMPRVTNVEHYARIVKEKAMLRNLIHTAHNIQQRAFGEENPAEILSAAKNEIEALHNLNGRQAVALFDSFEQFEKTPPISFSIRGFLQRNAITAICGLSGHGKTWIALSLCRALLFGPGKLWDFFEVPERAEKIIYLVPEAARSLVKTRLQLMGLYDEVRTGRLLIRTLNMGRAPELGNPDLLRAARGAIVVLDTGVRFMTGQDEQKAGEIAEGLSDDMNGLLRAEADGVLPLFHSPKGFLKESTMSLEGMIRGTGELGAVLSTAWGVRQLDRDLNIIHIQNLKPRDFMPCGPFQIIGRPHIDKAGDFIMHKRPSECGSLSDEQPELNKGGGAPQAQRQAKNSNLALLRTWLEVERNLDNGKLVEKFKIEGIPVDRSTISRYRKELGL
jgi:hypothetical protein